MDECRELAAWAETLPTRETAASDGFITNRLQFMQATLPARAIDDSAGEKRTAVYLAVLRGHGREAMRHMADEACRTLEWFPTPKQCLDLIAGYRGPASERETTLRLCQSFAQDAFETWLANIAEGQPIGDVPERWIGIAIERGPLRRLQGGVIVSRALYHGPFKPVE